MKFCCIFGISQECVTKGTCSKLFKQLAKSDAVICNRVGSFLYVFASYLGIPKWDGKTKRKLPTLLQSLLLNLGRSQIFEKKIAKVSIRHAHLMI